MGERFGPFSILARLGIGGMAETSIAERARQAGFVQRVCLKRIRLEQSADPEWVRMFQNEARLAATLQHPNIVAVYDFGEEDGTWWMALELVEGLDLRSLLTALRAANSRLPLDAVVFIAAELAKGLAYAHTRPQHDGTPAGIVHRDVSPSNVLISYDGAVKLADFGIAKATNIERTRSGGMKGKVPYMPPEQALGEDVDRRVDVFALGVMLFELLAGVRPFDGANEVATLTNIAAGRRKDLGELAPEVPAALAELVHRMIEIDRDRRPASADEVLDALAALHTPANVVRVLGGLVRTARPPQPLRSTAAIGATGDASPTSEPPSRSQTAVARPVGERSATADGEHSTPMTTSSAPRTRSRTGLAAAVTLAALIAAAAAIATLGAGPPQTAGPPLAASATSAETPVVPVAAASSAREAAASSAASTPPERPVTAIESTASREPRSDPARSPAVRGAERVEPELATLEVVVSPFGEVFIDGRSAGQSPVTRQLQAGRHVVEAQRGTDSARAVVVLQPGQERQLVLRPAQ